MIRDLKRTVSLELSAAAPPQSASLSEARCGCQLKGA